MYTESIYKVVNKDNNTSLPTIYTTFITAFEAACKWSDRAVVECYCGEFVEEVWNPEWQNINLCDCGINCKNCDCSDK